MAKENVNVFHFR